MNEITTIHIGRQPFRVSVDAYKALQEYLDAIKRQVGKQSKDVLEEIELRMAELLHERGATETRVVIMDDVEFLKQQLGKPGDFKEEAETSEPNDVQEDMASPKQLYRDTERGMLAGVSAGLSAYFGIDVVFIRILFVVAVVTGGWGILLYLLLWILVPEAKTSSERLQMRGQAVTVDSIKQMVEQADVKGAAARAGHVTQQVVHTALKVFGGLLGGLLIAGGVVLLLAMLTIGTYLLVHGVQVNNQQVFPLGMQELLATACALTMTATLGLLLLLGGAGLMRRKWSLPGWATGVLITLFLASAGVGTAVALDAVPQISDRVEAAHLMPAGDCENTLFSNCSYRY